MTDKSLLRDFIAETGEHLEDTERNLMRLEQQPNDVELLNDIFRSIHTIKGSSEYLGLQHTATLSHKLENLLDLLRRGELAADGGVIELLIATNDRLGLLLEELEKDQEERSAIDDLLTRIDGYCGQPDATPEAAGGEGYEDEYDEELFGIFVEQLQEGLNDLSREAEQLRSGQDGQAALERCVDQLTTLRSSANYMGYDDLKDKYGLWSQAVEEVRDQLAAGQSLDLRAFADDVMAVNINQIKALFPKVFELSGEEAPQETPAPVQEIPVDQVQPAEEDDGLLSDFILETGEHLEETEQNLMRLEKKPDDLALLNDIFRSIHTIKGSSEYLGMRNIAELSHKLENLLDMLRCGDVSVDADMIELLIAASDRISVLIEEIEKYRVEHAVVDDLIERIDNCVSDKSAAAEPVEAETTDEAVVRDGSGTIYSEAYDQELFSIFMKQLKSSLQILSAETEKLPGGQDIDQTLDRYEKQLTALRSSANYMDYGELRSVYDNWLEEITKMRKALSYESGADLVAFAGNMNANLDIVRRFFPNLPQPEVAPEDVRAEAVDEASVEEAAIEESAADSEEITDTEAEQELVIETVDEASVEEAAIEEPAADSEEISGTETEREQVIEPVSTPEVEPSAEVVEATDEASLEPEIQQPFVIPDAEVDSDFNVVTLDQLDTLADSKKVTVTTKLTDDVDSHLMSKLESAFDSTLGTKRIKEQVKLSVDIERILLSDDLPTRPQQSPAEQDHELTQEKVSDDGEGVESLLFSGLETAKSKGKGNLPQSLSKTGQSPDKVSPIGPSLDELRGRSSLGRRQTDKFRERMLRQSIRVDAVKIDDLMNQVGELVVSRSGFAQLFTEMRELQLALKQTMKLNPAEMQKVKELTNRINEATVSLGRVTSELQENVMKVRMLPIAQLFSRYPRLVHDLVKGTQKKVSLEIHGEDTELDKMVIEQIADPLVHIIRNAVDHGIEDVGQRLQKGKPEEGTLRLEAYHESNFVVIEISDDGRGMDAEQIKAEALEKSFVDEEEVERMSEQELLSLVMRPGFSTAREVTTTSGRGVGMDVVKDNIEKLNGTIEILSSIGAGVTIRIKIPLTLAIIPALMVRVGHELLTIPLPTVDETLRIRRDDISTIEGMEVYYLRESTVPLIRLAEVFNIQSDAINPEELFVVITNTGAKQVGLIVDELKAREEVVIKPLEDYLQEKSGFSGATILGDGNISLILDVYELVQLALGQYASRSSSVNA